MTRVLVCPFGGVNLLLTLFEKLRRACPGKYDITYLSYTEYGRAMYHGLDGGHVHIAPGESSGYFSDEDLAGAIEFSRRVAEIHVGRPMEAELGAAAHHYGAALSHLLEANSYDHVVLFNGRMNLFITVLDAVAQQRGIPRLVFEQGLFRPDYVTIDGRGVNWRNSIDSLDDLLSDEPFDYQCTPLYGDLTGLLPLRRDEIEDYKRRVSWLALLRAYVRMKVQSRRRIYLRTAEGRDLLEAAVWPKLRRAKPTQVLDSILSSPRFRYVVLCPFQVETDTQILLYSPYVRTMRDYMRIVLAALERFNAEHEDKACVLFKIHPMHDQFIDLGRDDAFIINESTVPAILEHRCDLLITVNSTAGIEAIEAHRPVITLGQAFYSLPGVVCAHCERAEDLPGHFAAALTQPTTDAQRQRRFIEALRGKYQVRLHE